MKLGILISILFLGSLASAQSFKTESVKCFNQAQELFETIAGGQIGVKGAAISACRGATQADAVLECVKTFSENYTGFGLRNYAKICRGATDTESKLVCLAEAIVSGLNGDFAAELCQGS